MPEITINSRIDTATALGAGDNTLAAMTRPQTEAETSKSDEQTRTATQRGDRLLHYPLDDLRGGRHILHQVDALAGP